MSDEYYSSPIQLTSQFYFCPVPLRLDTYSGCNHNCKYCFANNSNQKFISRGETLGNEVNIGLIKPTKLEYVKKYFDIAFEGKPNTFKNQEALAIEALRHKVPLHFGGMSDGFQPLERKLNISYEVLKLLKSYNYPIIISTKNSLITEEKYFNLLKDYENLAIQVSLIHTDDKVLKILEPNASSYKERLNILKKYEDKFTILRIQPIIPFLTEEILPELIKTASEYKVNHIITEGLKLFTSNPLINKDISNAFKSITGSSFDLEKYYKSIDAKYSGNDLELPTWRKYEYVKIVSELCKKYKIQFGSGDNDLRIFGDTPCCCGIANLKGFENVLKCNIGYAGFRATNKLPFRKSKDKFSFNLIKNEYIPRGDFRIIMSNKKLSEKFSKQKITYDDSNIDILKLLLNEWQQAGKNSPEQMINFKALNDYDEDNFRYYKILSKEEIAKKLTGFKQKTLI